jgi:iron(III) transport system ATP-binding protein
LILRVQQLCKSFGGANGAGVNGVSFEVQAGEFFTILGPSGCGKTTTLRCIAGLELPTGGEIEINRQVVYSRDRKILVPTAKRDIGMVFQSYAIWPHMTVGENIAFPLQVQNRSRADIAQRVSHALAMVGLQGFQDRPAPLLSGGQQQRVALARAVAKGAPLLLLDEPLSNLDANLREQMRGELRDLQKRLGVTAIYVTHDQEEALSLSDRIALMRGGQVIDVDTPAGLYFRPRTRFAAEFIGRADIWPCDLRHRFADSVRVDTPIGLLDSKCFPMSLASNICLTVRPEHIEIHADAPGRQNVLPGTVRNVEFSGRIMEYHVQVKDLVVRVQRTSETVWDVESDVFLRFPPERCTVINSGGY